jgi:hypothetical protein
MCDVERHDREVVDHVFTCPDQTRGRFYRGRARLSLIDASTGTPINTIPVRSDCENQNTFDIPYRIARFFYAVGGPINKYGKATYNPLLRGYNVDGDPLEFVLFDANSCTIVKTSLFGYSKTRDQVLQYPIRLIQREGAATIRN